MRHFLSIRDHTAEEIEALVTRAVQIWQGAAPKKLSGAFATVFYENSTRTRLSFQRAAEMLGLSHLQISQEGSSIRKGETLEDTLRTMRALGAVGAAVRTPQSHALEDVPRQDLGLSLINAGDGWAGHPTQALADLAACRVSIGSVRGRRMLIVGDVLHSRVARSCAEAFRLLGATLQFAGPPTLLPEGLAEALGGERVEIDRAIGEADLVLVLRLQRERQEKGYLPNVAEYRRYWGLTEERYARLGPQARVLHPGPQNRGIEIDAAVVTAEQSLIGLQVRAGVHARAALLEEVLSDAH